MGNAKFRRKQHTHCFGMSWDEALCESGERNMYGPLADIEPSAVNNYTHKDIKQRLNPK